MNATNATTTPAIVATVATGKPSSSAAGALVVGLGTLAINYPVAAFAVASVLILLILCFLGLISRTAWRWFSRRRGPVAAAG